MLYGENEKSFFGTGKLTLKRTRVNLIVIEEEKCQHEILCYLNFQILIFQKCLSIQK